MPGQHRRLVIDDRRVIRIGSKWVGAEIVKVEPVVATNGCYVNATLLRHLKAPEDHRQMLYGRESMFRHLVDLFRLQVPGVRATCEGPDWRQHGAVLVNLECLLGTSERRQIRQNRPRIVHALLQPPSALVGFRLNYLRTSREFHAVCGNWSKMHVPPHFAAYNEDLRRAVMPALIKHMYRWKKREERQDLAALHDEIEHDRYSRKETKPCKSVSLQKGEAKHCCPALTSPAPQVDPFGISVGAEGAGRGA